SATIDGTGSLWNNFHGLYVGFNGHGTLTITNGGHMTNGTFANVGFSVGANGTVTVSGADSNFTTGGALSIGGNVSGAGGTGLLHIDAGATVSAASLNVWSPGTLTGTGSVTNSTTTTIQGTLAPAQTISLAGNLTFGPTASTVITVTPPGAGNVAVQGTVALSGQLGVTFSGGPFTPGTQYTLLQAGAGLDGTTFASVNIDYPQGQGFTPQIDYDAGHVYLYLAPDGTPTPSPTPTPTATPTWVWQNPLPQGNRLASVSFVDENIRTAVGEVGAILRTTDGGGSWSRQESRTTVNLMGVAFTDANTGTAVGSSIFGSDGIILRTTDGGATWVTQESGLANGLNAVSFVDENNGTAVGNGGAVLRTTDGGNNWSSQTSGTPNQLNAVAFTDEDHGTAVGSTGKIIRTTDGGSTWFSQTSNTNLILNGVFFL